jgi:hypothetical protein
VHGVASMTSLFLLIPFGNKLVLDTFRAFLGRYQAHGVSQQ